MLNKQIEELVRQYGRPPTRSGTFGIEVEVEGRHLPMPVPSSVWTIHEDHSLRGEAYEYVLKSPLDKDSVKKALEGLSDSLKNSVIHKSGRTSVHVHVNMTSWLIQEVYTLISLYYIFEDLLVRFSGEERQGNMYCLRCSDAEYLILQLVASIANESYFPGFVGDNIRYSSLNLKPLLTFGSIEFRSFRGSVLSEEIFSWIEILDTLITASKRFNSPMNVISSYQLSQENFADVIFEGNPEFLGFLKRQPDLIDNMRHGYAYAFEIAYAPKRKTPWIDVSKVNKSKPRLTAGGLTIPSGNMAIMDWNPFEVNMAIGPAGGNVAIAPIPRPAPRARRQNLNVDEEIAAARERLARDMAQRLPQPIIEDEEEGNV